MQQIELTFSEKKTWSAEVVAVFFCYKPCSVLKIPASLNEMELCVCPVFPEKKMEGIGSNFHVSLYGLGLLEYSGALCLISHFDLYNMGWLIDRT